METPTGHIGDDYLSSEIAALRSIRKACDALDAGLPLDAMDWLVTAEAFCYDMAVKLMEGEE